MTKFIKFFIRDERGAAAAEYALILAVVAGGIAVGATLLGTNIATVITDVANEIVPPPA
ncbi:Flp family type IVb pilin [Novosphingobium sp. NPDC080210]|uniref:Flp family type IVb pilin n=1 Tax=Novosphingobium sp. NPDC080210 TaxID=3390596 RepID=UPI003D018424